MKPFLQFIVLTVVVFSFDIALGAHPCEESLWNNRQELSSKQTEAAACTPESKDENCKSLRARISVLNNLISNCEREVSKSKETKDENKQRCKDAEEKEKKILEKYNYESQRKAKECFAGDLDEKDDRVELVKNAKNTKEKISELQEERMKLQEKFEKLMEGAEDSQTKALNQMRDNQNKITDQIRKAQTELMNARLKLKNAAAERKKALTEKNVQTESAMVRTCRITVKKYDASAENPNGSISNAKKSVRSGGAGGFRKSETRNQDYTALMNECMTLQKEIRNQIVSAFEDHELQLTKFIQDIEAQITQLNEDYKKQVQDYNDAIQKGMVRLNKAQQKYYQDDLMLAQKIQEAQENAEQEQARLNQKKFKAQQKQVGYQNSQGTLSEREIQNAQDSEDDLKALEDDLKVCPNYAARQKADEQRRKRAEERDSARE